MWRLPYTPGIYSTYCTDMHDPEWPVVASGLCSLSVCNLDVPVYFMLRLRTSAAATVRELSALRESLARARSHAYAVPITLEPRLQWEQAGAGLHRCQAASRRPSPSARALDPSTSGSRRLIRLFRCTSGCTGVGLRPSKSTAGASVCSACLRLRRPASPARAHRRSTRPTAPGAYLCPRS